MKKLILLSVLLIYFFLFNVMFLHAQPPSFDDDTSDVPIDGGLSILLAMGIGYGIRKNLKQEHEHKKNKPAPNE